MSNYRILVVDDEEDLCEILKFNLENEGYEVDTANSAEEALRLDLSRYHLLLLDVMMGEISGFKMAAMLKKDKATANIPIIFITAKDTENDTVTGFNYELLQAFARDHGLRVEIHPEMAFDKCLEGLAKGKFDLIANGILATSELKDSLLLTHPITLGRQVLVQRKPAPDGNDSLYVKSLLDLARKTIYIPKDSPYLLRLRNLETEIGDTIYIREMEKYGPEQLISLVAHGDIDYAVCEESIALAASDSLPQIDTGTAIGFTQFYSWAVSKKSPALLDTLNAWIGRFKQKEEYKRILRKF